MVCKLPRKIETVNIRSFNLTGQATGTYSFEDGMTWAEFVASGYNIGGIFTVASGSVAYGASYWVCDNTASYPLVLSTAVIQANGTYYIQGS